MRIFDYDRVENIKGKRKKCWVPAFSGFPIMLSKGFPYRVDKAIAGDILTNNFVGKFKHLQTTLQN